MHRRTALASLALLTALARSGAAFGAESQNPVRLVPPTLGKINVAFLLSDGATIIDFCGPWEVFQDVAGDVPAYRMPFRLYTVAESPDPITASGGMRILPDYTLDDAPQPDIVVIPAQRGRSDHMLSWIRNTHKTADVTMSVCTGVFLLAETGLLKGRTATTHHDYYDHFAAQFPDVELRRGLRFVEDGKFVTAGGLTAGIDAALRLVERYFGRNAARYTTEYMEYQGTGWMIE